MWRVGEYPMLAKISWRCTCWCWRWSWSGWLWWCYCVIWSWPCLGSGGIIRGVMQRRRFGLGGATMGRMVMFTFTSNTNITSCPVMSSSCCWSCSTTCSISTSSQFTLSFTCVQCTPTSLFLHISSYHWRDALRCSWALSWCPWRLLGGWRARCWKALSCRRRRRRRRRSWNCWRGNINGKRFLWSQRTWARVKLHWDRVCPFWCAWCSDTKATSLSTSSTSHFKGPSQHIWRWTWRRFWLLFPFVTSIEQKQKKKKKKKKKRFVTDEKGCVVCRELRVVCCVLRFRTPQAKEPASPSGPTSSSSFKPRCNTSTSSVSTFLWLQTFVVIKAFTIDVVRHRERRWYAVKVWRKQVCHTQLSSAWSPSH